MLNEIISSIRPSGLPTSNEIIQMASEEKIQLSQDQQKIIECFAENAAMHVANMQQRVSAMLDYIENTLQQKKENNLISQPNNRPNETNETNKVVSDTKLLDRRINNLRARLNQFSKNEEKRIMRDIRKRRKRIA